MTGLIFYLIIVSGAGEAGTEYGEPYRWIQYGPFSSVRECQWDQQHYGRDIGGVMSACFGRVGDSKGEGNQ